jgi:hypothetical protein
MTAPKAKRLGTAAFADWLRARRADTVFREQLGAGITEFRRILESAHDVPFRRREAHR